MKFKATGLLLALAMLVGVTALPVSAGTTRDHAGVFTGTAKISKDGECDPNTGVATNEEGGGLGLDVTRNKNAMTWSITAGSVIDTWYNDGTANLCGHLNALKPVDGVQAGASCISTKGWGGGGVVNFPNAPPGKVNTLHVTNLTWKAAAGGTLIAYGAVDTMSKGKTDLLVAQVQVYPNSGTPVSCVEKETANKMGSQDLDVAATYEVLSGQYPDELKKSSEDKEKD